MHITSRYPVYEHSCLTARGSSMILVCSEFRVELGTSASEMDLMTPNATDHGQQPQSPGLSGDHHFYSRALSRSSSWVTDAPQEFQSFCVRVSSLLRDIECEFVGTYPQNCPRALKISAPCQFADSKLGDEGRLCPRLAKLVPALCISIQLSDSSRPGHRRILAIFLVDPIIDPIVSATDIRPQHAKWAADELEEAHADPTSNLSKFPQELADMVKVCLPMTLMMLDEAKEYRLRLMKERTVFEADHKFTAYNQMFNINLPFGLFPAYPANNMYHRKTSSVAPWNLERRLEANQPALSDVDPSSNEMLEKPLTNKHNKQDPNGKVERVIY
ncbi:hypothetical protein DFH08DRAFT_1001135 [Mycena albidolilacea]|uniref:DUF4246 domain-containing protein n=1 Tax=Mycena albidolilacea TaxID=1033008 RepID=A0AAD7A1X2_9AGAR|nr:hypothetical protein DFH08DRAFT_1001135 [Mycena albidolilacea]